MLMHIYIVYHTNLAILTRFRLILKKYSYGIPVNKTEIILLLESKPIDWVRHLDNDALT